MQKNKTVPAVAAHEARYRGEESQAREFRAKVMAVCKKPCGGGLIINYCLH